jgi:hypothetical protein
MLRLVQSLFAAHNDRAVAITRWSEGPRQEIDAADIEIDDGDFIWE